MTHTCCRKSTSDATTKKSGAAAQDNHLAVDHAECWQSSTDASRSVHWWYMQTMPAVALRPGPPTTTLHSYPCHRCGLAPVLLPVLWRLNAFGHFLHTSCDNTNDVITHPLRSAKCLTRPHRIQQQDLYVTVILSKLKYLKFKNI